MRSYQRNVGVVLSKANKKRCKKGRDGERYKDTDVFKVMCCMYGEWQGRETKGEWKFRVKLSLFPAIARQHVFIVRHPGKDHY